MKGNVNERNLNLLKQAKAICVEHNECLMCPFMATSHMYCHARVFFGAEVPESVPDGELSDLSRDGALPEDLWDALDEWIKEGES